MKRVAKISAAALAAASVIAGAPLANAAETGNTGQQVRVATTYAAGAIGDVFECGGAVGRYWCP